ncbi:MAG: transcriptional repressor LexA [Firmicutes bacterium]|nr:transcriptional repressor LexA [Bacillota bacterium]
MLKPRQQKILDFMKEEITTKGYPPTVREICAAIGIKSTSTVHKDIETLVSEGYLKKDPSKPRALMVVDPGTRSGHVDAAGAALKVAPDTLPANIVEVPVVGRVAAGEPIFAEQNIEDTFPLPDRFVNGGNNFMLRVRGESMIEAGIMDGDLILVQETSEAKNGEIVVALIDGIETGATVKTFYRKNGKIYLTPENKTMGPIIVDDATIVGKVKGVFRYFN